MIVYGMYWEGNRAQMASDQSYNLYSNGCGSETTL